jgi:hypothetical protein
MTGTITKRKTRHNKEQNKNRYIDGCIIMDKDHGIICIEDMHEDIYTKIYA